MKPFQIFFKIDNYPHECLVIDENEEKAKEQICKSYFGVEEITAYPITEKMIVDVGCNF